MKAYQKKIFGHLDGQEVFSYHFENDLGYRLAVMDYGATILEYSSPDRQGQIGNIVLAFDRFEEYIDNSPKFGASIGPVAGRIAGASFELNGQTYQLEANNGSNTNHSGKSGWDQTLFKLEEIDQQGLTFYTERPSQTGGFPGRLKVWISYYLTEIGELEISYQVQTDQDTLVNPTNHSYFNLAADAGQSIDSTVFQLNTLGIYPLSDISIPEKNYDASWSLLEEVKQGQPLADIFAHSDPQIRLVNGLDHPFALEMGAEQAGSLYDPGSGRYLIFKTDRPTVVVYTANSYDQQTYLAGQPARIHNGLALETQALPDAIHGPLSQQVILRAGQEFTSRTLYYASVKD
ncbi:aldose epimerase family protein [Streptococcus oricebi]|uniref:Aldose 1-epimerase n=1 Tax=Streptococcus oricebi TaxID=1547447 RepID=A0ABS5B645_9STRE|nr:aldose epimerase family protein [Streptococcus oricebi]MBP2624307.1 galactose mutarotase [Streptococcus oricebi]